MEDHRHGATFVLFTDFGADDIYVGQMKAALLDHAPDGVIIDLLHRAPAFDAKHAAHLLAALQRPFPSGTVFVAVVDPGVGGPREAVAIEAEERWYVGPDNGLLSVVAARSGGARTWRIAWRPQRLSASFHGRDLFAPVAAWIGRRALPAGALEPIRGLGVELGDADLAEIIYIDHYGNALTGLRAHALPRGAMVGVGGRILEHVRVFGEAAPGSAFWYENSIGLVEIAANRGSAAAAMHLAVGDAVQLL